MPRRVGIVGPTATGKSDVAHRVALALGDVEVVTVDSMQVYAGMDIGTAKPSPAMQREVRYHLLDVAEPADAFTVGEFQTLASTAIADIESRGRRPMLVGGTGLYLRAVVDELDIPGRYPEIRAELEAREDVDALYGELVELDPAAAARMEPGNRRRIVRALEVCLGSGRPFSASGTGLETYPATAWDVVCLDVDQPVLAERIRVRLDGQVSHGLIDEVRTLRRGSRPIGRTAAQALGYRQLGAYLDGDCELEDAVDKAVVATRRFARRQRSWFRRDPRLHTIDVTTTPVDRVVVQLIDRWRIPL